MARRAHEFLPKKPRRLQAMRWHVGDTDKATINGVPCKCIKADEEGYIFESISKPPEYFPYTVEQYAALLDGQDFDLEPDGLSLAKAKAKLKAGVSSTKELAAPDQILVDLREIAVRKFGELCASGVTSKYRPAAQHAIEEHIRPYVVAEAQTMASKGLIVSVKIPDAKEFLKWVSDYKEMGRLGLVPGWHRCGNRKRRYVGRELALVMKHAFRFLTPERPTREILYKDLKKEIADLNASRRIKGLADIRLPDVDFFNRQIATLAPFDVDAAHHLLEHALRRFHPSKGGISGLFRPLQRVEVDDWECHLHSLLIDAQLWDAISPEMQAEAEKTRCFLSVAICGVTRVIPAMVLSLEPNSLNTAQLLRMCMSDKTALAQWLGCETPWEYRGLPYQFAGDEGSAILNVRTRGICDVFDVEYQSPQIETPQQRAKVERVFQTIEFRSLLRFSGRAFSNPQVRGKYQAAARACVTVAELANLLVRFVVDEYHNTGHAGLDGATPRFRWLQLTKKFAPRSVAGKPLLRRGFGESYKITLQAEGIEIFGNWYTSPTVQNLFRTRLDREYVCIVDSEDLGGVTLRVDGGFLEVPGPGCMNGVSIDVWDAALVVMRRENKDIENLVEPVVNRAVGFAQMADQETRKRLGIRFRPKTPGELERLRNSIGRPVRFAADRNPTPVGPIDILSGGIAVGTKAPKRLGAPPLNADVPAVAPVEKPANAGRPSKAKQSKPTTLPRKTTRPWKPKDRS